MLRPEFGDFAAFLSPFGVCFVLILGTFATFRPLLAQEDKQRGIACLVGRGQSVFGPGGLGTRGRG